MRFEKLNESNGKGSKMFLCGLILGVSLLIVSNLFLTKAKYKVVDSAKLVESNINYKIPDLNVIAMYKNDGAEDIPIDKIPTDNYYSIDDDKSYCIVKSNSEHLKGNMTIENNKININITEKGTKCYIYLIKSSLKTLQNLREEKDGVIAGAIHGTSCANGTNNIEHNKENCTLEENGIYEVEGDGGKSYVYRGTVNNNWVKFANMYWRIIRINEDGTLRIIYSGTTPSKDGRWTDQDKAEAISKEPFNINNNDNKYVGFMYGGKDGEASKSYEEATKNETNSNILTKLIEWYNSNLGNNPDYYNLIDGNTGFCNDREINTNEIGWWQGEATPKLRGYGTNTTSYAAFSRFLTPNNDWKTIEDGATPTLKCKNKNRDLFTTKESKQGNKALPVPIGLITADEAIYAGSFGGAKNWGYWLNINNHYWSISSSTFGENKAYVFLIYNDGSLGNAIIEENRYTGVNNLLAIRPVINLKANLNFTGNGLVNTPYEISE